MKKLVSLIVCILLLLGVSACKSDDSQQNNSSIKVPAQTNGNEKQNDSSSQNSTPQININTVECFVESGRRMVDRKEVSKKEFTEKYAFVLPEDFETANFYFDIPTEDGLEYYNEVENGYIRCLGKDRKRVLDVYICKTRYIGCGFISGTKAELKKTYINKTNLIITKNSAGEYRGKFEKNGYYYTFVIAGIDENSVLSALEDLTE